MQNIITVIGLCISIVGLLVTFAQLRRTPKPKAEPQPFTPTSVMIIGVSMHRGRDLL